MTAPALNAAISIHEKISQLPSKVVTNGHAPNGVNGVKPNGVNAHHNHHGASDNAATSNIVKEAPFNTGRGRPLRVVCIGAGAAGIYLGLKLPRTISPELCELQVCLVLFLTVTSSLLADRACNHSFPLAKHDRYTRRILNSVAAGLRTDIVSIWI